MPSPDFSTLALLIITGFIAGVCNAIAGGGTFFTLPIFLAAGLPPVLANASNAVAVWPGHILASVGYREVLRQDRRLLLKSAAIGLAGALVGAYALSTVGNARFRVMIPWLILLATVLFASGARLHAFFNTLQSNRALSLTHPNGCGVLIQFILAVYGGFFSAGLGVMLMAMLMAFGIHDMQRNNAYKNASRQRYFNCRHRHIHRPRFGQLVSCPPCLCIWHYRRGRWCKTRAAFVCPFFEKNCDCHRTDLVNLLRKSHLFFIAIG